MATEGKDTMSPSEPAGHNETDPKPAWPCLAVPIVAASLANALAKGWRLLSARVVVLILAVLVGSGALFAYSVQIGRAHV
jgi:hypothetical protein